MKKFLSIMIALVGWSLMLQGQNAPNDNMMEEQALMQEQQKAIKAIFSDKEILRNFNSAVIKDGKIVKLSNEKDADGISFWHEHCPSFQDTLPANICRIYDPSWEAITYCTPCGLLKYQMASNSSYANQTPRYILLETCIDDPSAISSFESIDPQVSSSSSAIDFTNYCFATSFHTSLVSLFTSNQLIYDNPHYVGAFNGDVTFHRPIGFDFQVYNSNFVNTFYSQTEFSDPNNNRPIYTLRSGNYIPLLVLPYRDPNDNNKDFYVLKWFNLRVENYYLGDVGVENHDAQQAQIAVYPNPTADIVNVQLTMNNEQSNNVEIQLFDMFGKMLDVVETQNFASLQTTKIDMSPYANGVYFIKAVSEGNVLAVRKVVKNR
ncbi:MAG: T9SS type A sorting domain-containing protein [Bacteroidales bacterium]|nr:T9SS type A sorting domain-containing protein [Bacteroidales bacterium]